MRRAASAWGACLILVACNPTAPKPTPGPSIAASPTPVPLHISGRGTASQPVHTIYQVRNRIVYELVATSFESQGVQGKTNAVFHHARITFHDPSGSRMTAAAPQALLDEAANTVTLIDGVHARSGSGTLLLCDRLVYDRDTQMLHGTGNVTIIDPQGFKATGSSFVSDVSLTHMTMR